MDRFVPRGVAKGFLRILDDDRRTATRRTWVAAILLAVLTVPAWFLAPPWGPLVHIGAAAAGVGIGLLVVGAVHGRYERSLTDQWEEWMTQARDATCVPAVGRAVRDRGRGGVVTLLVLGILLLWFAEVGTLWYAFTDAESLLRALPALLLNGLAAGSLLGYVVRRGRWSRTFRASINEMVADGELGVWGTR
jgi:hypothetical protein